MRQNRCLMPDFIVIGAMKCGTTTLTRHLDAHPQIGMSRDKETDFFVAEKNYTLGLEWYSDQFNPAYDIHGEASPNYAKIRDFPGVPWRIHHHCPDVRLIYIVRDPVERAKAQFRHVWLMGTHAGRPNDLYGTHEYHHIMDSSHYGRQIEAYLEAFDREALLIIDFDVYLADPQAALDRVYDHLGVARREIKSNDHYNDSRELSRIPAPILRLAQTRLGKSSTRLIGRSGRDRLRRLVALGRTRQPEEFPPDLEQRMRDELADDVAAFRRISGMPFSTWSL